mgnify:CR=1 FL=1
MTDVLRLDGNYRIVTQANGTITLDTRDPVTGISTGTVRVFGNLDIQGATSLIETTNVETTSTIMYLNYGQSTGVGGTFQITGGSGLDYGKSGLIIDRSVCKLLESDRSP